MADADWRNVPSEGWDLQQLPDLLAGIEHVIWVICPHNEGEAARDGDENAALSVMAGYAHARHDIALHVLTSANARDVADVVAQKLEFHNRAEFRQCLEKLQDVFQAAARQETRRQTIEPERPLSIAPLPQEDWDVIDTRFIGRQLYLADLLDALLGMRQRYRTRQQPQGGAAVQLFWIYGFGGMGKSWFLRKALIEAERYDQTIHTVLIDWDSPVWRAPLMQPPLTPSLLLEPIVIRLAQRYGIEVLDDFWLAQTRVRQAAKYNQSLWQNFNEQLERLRLGAGDEPDLAQLLASEGLWTDAPAQLKHDLLRLNTDPQQRERLFEAWCHTGGRMADCPDHDAAIRPDYVLVQGLQAAIRRASQSAPLLLVLDTCEELNADMDRWLRRLLTGVRDDSTLILILIGSRLAPDVSELLGSREGWRAEMRGRLREVIFNEQVYCGKTENPVGHKFTTETRLLTSSRDSRFSKALTAPTVSNPTGRDKNERPLTHMPMAFRWMISPFWTHFATN